MKARHRYTKENYLGKTVAGKRQLNIHNKLHLTGHYVEEIQK